MKDNATRFIEAYSIIESHLKDIVNSDTYLKFFQLVNEVSKTNEIIASNKKELIEYSQLRNAIIHQRGSYDEIIAQPVDSVVNNIEYIANALRRDKKIKYLIKDSFVYCMQDDKILDAYMKMDKLNTSKLPVYNDNKFLGFVTIKDICKWAVNGSKVQYVKDIIRTVQEKDIIFRSQDILVSQIISLFENDLKHGNRLFGIIILENDDINSKPLAIYTAYDMPYLINYLHG